MSDHGGLFGAERIQWFNGGLFDGAQVLPLTAEEIKLVDAGLPPRLVPGGAGHLRHPLRTRSRPQQALAARRPLHRPRLDHAPHRAGAHGASAPRLRGDQGEGPRSARRAARRSPPAPRPDKNPVAVFNAFLERLRAVRVLDPACGSGNFLYLALQALKDLEREAILWASGLSAISDAAPGGRSRRRCSASSSTPTPPNLPAWSSGSARSSGCSTIRRRLPPRPDPAPARQHRVPGRGPRPLATPSNPREPEWPEATVIVGNPPFLGGKLLRANLGDDYVDALFAVYRGRVPREADWSPTGTRRPGPWSRRAGSSGLGFLPPKASGAGRTGESLERIKETGDIFLAWSDEPWVVEGAAVHVSFVGYDDGEEKERVLDGQPVVEHQRQPDRRRRPDPGTSASRRTWASPSWATRRAGPSTFPETWPGRCWRVRIPMGDRTPTSFGPG